MSSGRKREIDKIMNESSCDQDDKISVEESKTEESEAAKLKKDFTAALPSFSRLRLEAIFHPKFENENLNDQQIRAEIKERVASGSGYLEVTLKHSGSLILWSGGQRYYSKNSTGNRFTGVGEILLRQHFVRSFWNDREDKVTPENIEEEYHRCSQFVQEHRLTLAFEVVTAVLGDHGAIPKRDFLILTAVADRSKESFYSTEELLELAQRFRLPHNDSWVCASAKSVDDLFSFYDAFRETGLAQGVVTGLSNLSETHVSSLYPHIEFQGEILEGLVIRFVSYQGRTDVLERIDRFSSVAQGLHRTVPSDLPSCFVMVAGLSASYPSILQTDIRKLFASDGVVGQEEGGALRFEARIKDEFTQSSPTRRVDHVERSPERDMIQARMKDLVDSEDDETRRIAVLVRTLSELNARVEYAVVREALKESIASNFRWICMIHVFFDKTFQKFRSKAKQGDMPLFRGFAIELDDNSLDRQTNLVSNNDDPTIQSEEVGESLMLKMKFLPYMVRTFACRNGLRVIKQGGANAFVQYTSDLLSKWKISSTSRLKWQPFFLAWALYVETANSEEHRPPTDGFYLRYFERFQNLYGEGHFDEGIASWNKSPFRGLVVVVAPTLDSTVSAAGFIAKELGGAQLITNINDITPERMVSFYEPGSGAVCCASVVGGLKHLRKILKYGADGVSIVLVGCSDAYIAGTNPSDEAAKLMGMLKIWKKTRCSFVSELPASFLVGDHNAEAGTSSTHQPNDTFHDKVSRIRDVSNALKPFDSRPGGLVFFPGIPGCGKSSLLGDATVNELRAVVQAIDRERPRKLVVQVGDKTRQKFWPLVRQDRLLDRSCVYFADKNVPYQTWPPVAEICAATKGVAVPIIPDAATFRTTKLKVFRRANGDLVEKEHFYPFSLQYLAVCMARVVARPAGEHDGKLDSGTPRACMIVAKFFSLYRNISSDDFYERMKSCFNRDGALLSKPVEVPFFTENGGSEPLPADLEETLMQVLQVQVRLSVFRCVYIICFGKTNFVRSRLPSHSADSI